MAKGLHIFWHNLKIDIKYYVGTGTDGFMVASVFITFWGFMILGTANAIRYLFGKTTYLPLVLLCGLWTLFAALYCDVRRLFE